MMADQSKVKDVNMAFRVPHEVQDVLERHAEAKGVTVSDLVREGLRKTVPGIKRKLK